MANKMFLITQFNNKFLIFGLFLLKTPNFILCFRQNVSP